jgi:hypothetical protein
MNLERFTTIAMGLCLIVASLMLAKTRNELYDAEVSSERYQYLYEKSQKDFEVVQDNLRIYKYCADLPDNKESQCLTELL